MLTSTKEYFPPVESLLIPTPDDRHLRRIAESKEHKRVMKLLKDIGRDLRAMEPMLEYRGGRA